MTPQHIVARELVANAEALRSLARDLVGPNDAADLVQETSLRALRSPPAQPRGLGAWLATILRNLAGNHRRSVQRRRMREQVAADREPVQPPADEDAQRREVLRSVTEGLWRLPEPYQSALVWRYFENLTPKQIAEQKGIPIATVKSRLQRGLGLLRVEFDRRDGGRWRALLPIAAGLSQTPVAATAAIAILMTPTTKVLSAAAVLAAAACLVFVWDNSEPTPEPTTRHDGGAREASVAGVNRDEQLVDKRTLVSGAEGESVSLVHPHEYRLRVAVIDRDGLPMPGASVVIGPRDSAVNRWPQATGEDGTVEVDWRGKVQTMHMAVGLTIKGRSQALRQVDVRAGATRDIVLLAEYGGGGGSCMAALRAASISCTACHKGPMVPNVFDIRLMHREGLHPESHLSDLLLATPPHVVPMEEEESEEMEFAFTDVTETVETAADPEVGAIRGTVLGTDGKPVASTTVIWSRTPDRPEMRTRTNRTGDFEFKGIAPGTVEVRAGGGSPGIGRRSIQVFAKQTASCDLQLDQGDVLAGRVLLPEGANADGWRAEFVADDESWIDGTVVATDGSFRLANLPRGSGMVLLWSSTNNRLPAAVEAGVAVGTVDLVIDLRTVGLPSGQLSLRPTVPGHVEPANVDVWVWHVESRRGAMALRKPDGTFLLPGLASGFYQVKVAGAGVGVSDLGEHWFDGKGDVDLGAVRLPDSGRLRIEGLGVGEPLDLCLRRPDVDLRGELEVGDRRELWLPPGRWLALWGAPESLRKREFVVSQEGETVLDLRPTPR